MYVFRWAVSIVRAWLYISALKHARKVKFGMCVPIEGINTIYEYRYT